MLGLALGLVVGPVMAQAASFDGVWGVTVETGGPPIRCTFTLSSTAGVSLSASCDEGTAFSASGYQYPTPDAFITELFTPVNGVYYVNGAADPTGTYLGGVIGLLTGFEIPFSGGRCGNGQLDGPETCDGGVTGDPCCTSDCQAVPDGGACAAAEPECNTGTCQAGSCVPAPVSDGTQCELDGDACTRDACSGGTCLTASCSPCCDGGSGCAAPDVIGCSGSLTRATRIDLRTQPSGKEQLSWQVGGVVTSAADVGDPTVGGDYELCVFDAQSPRRLVIDATLPAASLCGTKPCWQTTATAVQYKNATRSPDGIERAIVRLGPTGTGRVVVRGKGPGLSTHTQGAVPLAPLVSPVTIVLKNPTACWATDFGAPGTVVIRNEPGRFTARLGQ